MLQARHNLVAPATKHKVKLPMYEWHPGRVPDNQLASYATGGLDQCPEYTAGRFCLVVFHLCRKRTLLLKDSRASESLGDKCFGPFSSWGHGNLKDKMGIFDVNLITLNLKKKWQVLCGATPVLLKKFYLGTT